jgi:hypothetical protein
MWYRETGRLFFLFHLVFGSFFFLFAGAMMRLVWIAPLRVIPPPFYFLPVCIFVVRVSTRCVFVVIFFGFTNWLLCTLSPLFTSCFYTLFTIIIGHAITTQHYITSTNYREAHICSNEKCQLRYNYLTKMKMK